LNKPRHAGILL